MDLVTAGSNPVDHPKKDMTKGLLAFIILVLIISVVSWRLIPKMQSVEPTKVKTMEKFTELKIEDIVVGTGAEVKTGDIVVMHYTGTLIDGTRFDSSWDRKQPFETKIGVGQVIVVWDKGVPGMKVGGKRKLYIPASMAYGEREAGGVIGPNADLIFEVELLGIK